MAIQTGPYPLVFDADDFVRIDRGVRWGIKFHRVVGMVDTVVFVSEINGVQSREMFEQDFDDAMVKYGGDVIRWIKEKLIPALNAWLAQLFKPQAAPSPTPAPAPAPLPAGKYEQAFVLSKGIKITVNADGTIIASA